MLNLTHLQSFVTVINEGSMTGAADKLFLTQPAISQQIRNLEETLGADVLVRGVRQVRPTLQGELLYDYAKRILQLSSQAKTAVKTMGAELKGRLRIGTLNSFGVNLMGPIVARLLRYNPNLHLSLDYALGEDLLKSFQQGELDIVILPDIQHHFSGELANADRKFLLKEEMWLVGTGRDTEIPPKISLNELVRHPLVMITKEYPGFQSELEGRFRRAGVELAPSFASSNVGTLKRVIESGLGWGFLPSQSIRKQVKMGRLNRVIVEDFHYEMELFFYSRKDSSQLSTLVDIFYQAFSQQDRG